MLRLLCKGLVTYPWPVADSAHPVSTADMSRRVQNSRLQGMLPRERQTENYLLQKVCGCEVEAQRRRLQWLGHGPLQLPAHFVSIPNRHRQHTESLLLLRQHTESLLSQPRTILCSLQPHACARSTSYTTVAFAVCASSDPTRRHS